MLSFVFVPRIKKIKLEIDDEIEFPILGISTALGDYRLAWELNSKLNLRFERSIEGTYFSIPDRLKKTVNYDYYSNFSNLYNISDFIKECYCRINKHNFNCIRNKKNIIFSSSFNVNLFFIWIV